MLLLVILAEPAKPSWADATLAVVNSVANIFMAIGTIVVARDVPRSIKFAARDQENQFYAILDRTYFDIQSLIIQYPHLANTDLKSKTAAEAAQYDAFAFNVWNFIEAIADYSKNDDFLTKTWGCILRLEAAKHAAWFGKPENRVKFKQAFIDYIEGNKLL